MSSKETWFCAQCGSLDIRHDAVVRYNPETQDYELLSVLDNDWCEDCMGRGLYVTGDPMFGITGEENCDE